MNIAKLLERENEYSSVTIWSIRTVAIVFCLISVILSGMMISNYNKITDSNPVKLRSIKKLWVKIKRNPDNKVIVEKYRTLEKDARETFHKGLRFSKKGAVMLTFSVAVMLFALKILSFVKLKIPNPQTISQENFIVSNKIARWTLIVIGLALIFLPFLLGIQNG